MEAGNCVAHTLGGATIRLTDFAGPLYVPGNGNGGPAVWSNDNADSFVILCRTPEEASQALALVRDWVETNGLSLHPTKTKVVDAGTDGFDFLGYHFRGTKH